MYNFTKISQFTFWNYNVNVNNFTPNFGWLLSKQQINKRAARFWLAIRHEALKIAPKYNKPNDRMHIEIDKERKIMPNEIDCWANFYYIIGMQNSRAWLVFKQ